MLKSILLSLSILIFIIIVIVIIGLLLPKKRIVSKTAYFKTPREKIFKIITDSKGQLGWRNDLKDIVIISEDDDKYIEWIEIPKRGSKIKFKTTKIVNNQYYEFEFEGNGFNGIWQGTYEETKNGTTKLIHVENIEIKNPIIRLLSYLFFDIGATMDLYFEQLANKIGERYIKP